MLRSRFVGIIFLLSIAIPSLVLAQDAGRLTSASNVRLRSEPVDSAGVVVTVPLGTALVVQLKIRGRASLLSQV